MHQKLMIFSIIILGLASCSAPKKATYVRPVISAKSLETATSKETFSGVDIGQVEPVLETYRRNKFVAFDK